MRLIYLDSALADRVGHHSNYCRLITTESRRRGIATLIGSAKDISAELKNELDATPLFRWGTYKRLHIDHDPISGWLRDFDLAWRTTLEDLKQISPIRSDDVVYFSSAHPAQFMAIAQWMWQLTPGDRPRVMVEFATEPGLQSMPAGRGKRHYEVPDPRRNARAMLYHHVATLLQPDDLSRLRLVTFDPAVSEIYRGLLGVAVGAIPLPLTAVTNCRLRRGGRPITVSVLGHQRTEKGYQFVPEVIGLLADLPGVRFLVHNSAPDEMIAPQEALRSLAAKLPTVTLDEAPASGEQWANLLDASDLTICPYEPERYTMSYSGVLADCLANGIPTVLPAETRLSAISKEYGGVSADFAEWNAGSIAEAVRVAVSNFDELADRASAAAKRWTTLHGPAKVIDALINNLVST